MGRLEIVRAPMQTVSKRDAYGFEAGAACCRVDEPLYLLAGGPGGDGNLLAFIVIILFVVVLVLI